ncbi:MAG: ABC transporter substrate-binding protein [Propionicimonas sp.]|nr:ABC transporter substrate-binding protein [Propionicimonas sp.]
MRTINLAVPALAGIMILTVSACSGGSAQTPVAASSACTAQIADSELVTPGTLTMSTNATLPPMQYVDASGETVGMRIDLGKRIAEELCLTPEFINVDFDSQIPGVQGGRWDMINTGMFYTAERSKTILLVPYEIQGVAISVAKGNPLGITSEDDLAGKTVAVEAPGYEFDTLNSLNESLKAAGQPEIQILTFKTNADAFQALSAGQADGVAIVESVTTYYQDNGAFETAVHGLNKAPLALGFSNQTVADEVAGALNNLKQDGYLSELFDSYGVTAYDGDIKVTTGELDVK